MKRFIIEVDTFMPYGIFCNTVLYNISLKTIDLVSFIFAVIHRRQNYENDILTE